MTNFKDSILAGEKNAKYDYQLMAEFEKAEEKLRTHRLPPSM